MKDSVIFPSTTLAVMMGYIQEVKDKTREHTMDIAGRHSVDAYLCINGGL